MVIELNKMRNSKFELLKIIAIFMVILLHANNYGGLLQNGDLSTYNKIITYIIEAFSIVAVNIFVMTSGYYLVQKKSIKVRKCIELFLSMAFYAAILFVILLFTHQIQLNFPFRFC